MHEFDGRNADAFLRDFATGAHGAGIHSADVGMVGAVGDVERRTISAREKNGRDHGDVGQMRAATIGIVEDRNIAGREAEIGENSGDGHGHGAEMDGHVVAHRDEVALGGEDGGGVVAAFLDVGREGGAAQGRSHLDCDGVERVTNDGDFSGIGLAARGHRRAPAFGVRRRFESGSTTAVQPVGRYVVALSSVMTAGPMMRLPG